MSNNLEVYQSGEITIEQFLTSLGPVDTIPIDRDMAKVIISAFGVAEHESQICFNFKDETVSRVVRVLKVLYPDLVEDWSWYE